MSEGRRQYLRDYHARYIAEERAGKHGGPTYAQIVAIRAVLETGSIRAAAHVLGLNWHTVQVACSSAYRRLGVDTLAQAVAKLDDENPGWRKRRLDWLAEFKKPA